MSTLKKNRAKIAARIQQEERSVHATEIPQKYPDSQDANVVHLHNHSQFSVLQSTISITDLVAAAADNQMPAVALTDHGNMMGAFHFVKAMVIITDIRQKNKTAEAE